MAETSALELSIATASLKLWSEKLILGLLKAATAGQTLSKGENPWSMAETLLELTSYIAQVNSNINEKITEGTSDEIHSEVYQIASELVVRTTTLFEKVEEELKLLN